MAYKDDKAPAALQVVILDGSGKEWGRMFANQKDFKTGSKGYYANGKVNNPDNPEARYQCGLTFTLIGSKGE
ncbi:MAG: hypothetical protein LBU82_07910 [Treponema sp.]|jgi:hypothetical protein|nr:hypothetical protein [Treponema sp.]